MWADEIQQSVAENYDRYLRAVRQRSLHAGQQVAMVSMDADDSMQLQVAEPVFMASGDAFDTMPLPEADRIYELSDEGTLNEVEVEAPESAVALAARYLVRVLLLGLEDMSSDEQRDEAVAAAQGEMLRIAALYDDRYDVSNVRHQDVPTGYSGPDGNDTMVLLDTGDDVPSPRVVNMVKASGDETDGDSSGDAAATAQGGAGQEAASIENQSEAGAASGVEAQEGAFNEACVQVHTMLSDAITGDKTLAEWLKVPLSMAATGRGAVLEALCTELSTVAVAHLDGFWKTGPPKLDVTDTGWKVNVEQVVSALLQVREASRKRERSPRGRSLTDRENDGKRSKADPSTIASGLQATTAGAASASSVSADEVEPKEAASNAPIDEKESEGEHAWLSKFLSDLGLAQVRARQIVMAVALDTEWDIENPESFTDLLDGAGSDDKADEALKLLAFNMSAITKLRRRLGRLHTAADGSGQVQVQTPAKAADNGSADSGASASADIIVIGGSPSAQATTSRVEERLAKIRMVPRDLRDG
jgi:hypothetical protein